ncbi:MAG: CPBP family intramembrane metalloprotease [Chloroflexi bacterium]|nr:CPBP family intramembrane metalloprotease [Chloroflexota bacterium]
MSKTTTFVSQRPLIIFFCLAYAITWILWGVMIALSLDIKNPLGSILNALAIFGPTLAGIILSVVLNGKQGLSDLIGRVSMGRAGLSWIGIALLIPFLIIIASLLIGSGMGSPIPTKLNISIWLLPLLLEGIRIFFVGGPLGEEIGWRGFALPRLLQSNKDTMKASLILGLIWGIWHAPIYAIAGTGQNDILQTGGSFFVLFPAFVIWVMGLAVIFTWLYKSTNGNLLIAILFHTAVNTAAFFPSAIGSQFGMTSLLNAGFTWVVAVIVSRTKVFRE